MNGFSAGDAGLIGFRLARENRTALIAWSIVGVVFLLLQSLAVAHFVGPAIAELAGRNPLQPMTPAELTQLSEKFSGFGPAMMVLFPIIVIVSGLLNASVNRIVLSPADSTGSPLRLGPVELRQMLVALLQALISGGVLMGAVMLATLAATVVALVSGALGGLVVFLGLVAAIGAYVYVTVRLSLLGPLAFETGRIALREAWLLSAGRFWPMLGAYVIAFVMGSIVSMLGGAIFMGIAGIAFGAATPNPTSVAAVFTPVHLVYLVFTGVIWALMQMIMLGAAPSIYKQIKNGPVAAD